MMAFVLLIGMAQCKKEQVTPSENNGVNITLKVDGGSEKLNVFPSTGAVVFTDGDEIYVGNNGKYVGTLTYSEGLFQGTIESEDFSTNDYLHFYFVGNKPTSPTALSAGTTTYTVDISDQTAYLPVISYAPSKAKYSPSTTFYTAQLLNKSALVKFVPAEATNKPITVLGLNNEVQIDFEHNTLAPTGTTGGITLYSVSDTEKWAILLAQEAVPNATVTISGYASTVSLPTITNNMYCNSGLTISMTATIPVGAIDGKFSVAANKQVYFSQGNLQYQANSTNAAEPPYTPIWRFAEHQWDFVGTQSPYWQPAGGTVSGSDNNAISESYSGWIDLFGWGTSGYDHGATAYQPWSASTNDSHYYAYGSNTKNLYDAKPDGSMQGQADWGYNAISNGGNMENSGWHTLSSVEWSYVLSSRANYADKRGLGNVNSVNGIILLPDDWTLPEGLSFTAGISGGYANNTYTADQWAQMEANGAVFLPAAGWRVGYQVYTANSQNTLMGNYWSSSYCTENANEYAWGLCFALDRFWVRAGSNRREGHSVRLVRDVE